MKTSDYKSFVYLENGDINFSQFETIKSSKELERGSYIIDCDEKGSQRKVVLKTNPDFEIVKTHSFPDKDKIDVLFDSFFDKDIRTKIEYLGFCHKIGILLHGIEGTGKSSIIKYYCNHAINKHNAIVFYMLCNTPCVNICWEFIQAIRGTQDNPIIIVFDEFDNQMKYNESYLKTVIDGNMSISNCIFFASTNYLDKIPKAMCERPSRFKYCLNIEGIQGISDIIDIITPILNDILSDDDIKIIANELKGNTIDYIKQFCFDKIMDIKHYGKRKNKIGF